MQLDRTRPRRGPIDEVIFVWYERNVPSVVTNDFRLLAGTDATVRTERTTSCLVGNCPGPVTVSAAGVNDAINDYLIRYGADTGNPTPLANKLIQLSIKQAPENIGPLITILQLDHEGPHWIQNRVGCPISLGQ
jgi:hypothetical protein